MPRVVQLSEFKRRGAGMFIRDLGDDYIVIANERNPKHSFVVMGLEPFIKFITPFKELDALYLNTVHTTIKDKISKEMSRRKKGIESVDNSNTIKVESE